MRQRVRVGYSLPFNLIKQIETNVLKKESYKNMKVSLSKMNLWTYNL